MNENENAVDPMSHRESGGRGASVAVVVCLKELTGNSNK